MTGAEVAQLMASGATLLGVVYSIYRSERNGRAIEKVQTTANAVVTATDGMKDQLVAATKISAKSEGRDEERRNPTT